MIQFNFKIIINKYNNFKTRNSIIKIVRDVRMPFSISIIINIDRILKKSKFTREEIVNHLTQLIEDDCDNEFRRLLGRDSEWMDDGYGKFLAKKSDLKFTVPVITGEYSIGEYSFVRDQYSPSSIKRIFIEYFSSHPWATNGCDVGMTEDKYLIIENKYKDLLNIIKNDIEIFKNKK